MSEGNRGPGPEGQAPPASESTAIRRPGDAKAATDSTPPVSGQNAPGQGAPETPVWDPPPPAKPRAPLRDRIGRGKKDGAGEEPPHPLVPPAKPQQPAAGNNPAPNQNNPAPNQSAPNRAAPNRAASDQPSQQGQNPWQRPQATSADQAGATTGAQAKDSSADETSVLPAAVGTAGAATAGAAATGSGSAGSAAQASSQAPATAAAPGATNTGAATPGKPDSGKSETLETDAKHKAGQARRTRKARLRLSRVDPWSVMKTSFLFSIAAGIMMVVAVYVVWTVIGSSGLFDSVNEMVQNVVSTPGDTTPFQIEQYINTPKVMGVTALLACVDVVIFTALATLGSFLYNLAATMLGGLEVTLAED